MGPVLAANILTCVLVWCFVKYGQLERENREKLPGSGLYLSGIIMVFAFLLFSFLASGFFDRAIVRFAG